MQGRRFPDVERIGPDVRHYLLDRLAGCATVAPGNHGVLVRDHAERLPRLRIICWPFDRFGPGDLLPGDHAAALMTLDRSAVDDAHAAAVAHLPSPFFVGANPKLAIICPPVCQARTVSVDDCA